MLSLGSWRIATEPTRRRHCQIFFIPWVRVPVDIAAAVCLHNPPVHPLFLETTNKLQRSIISMFSILELPIPKLTLQYFCICVIELELLPKCRQYLSIQPETSNVNNSFDTLFTVCTTASLLNYDIYNINTSEACRHINKYIHKQFG